HDRAEPVPERAVPDLVVVLRADDEPLAGQIRAGRAPGPPEIRRLLALEGEALGDRAGDLGGSAEVGVVAVLLPGEMRVERVVKIVRPHGVQADAALARGP